MTFWQSPPLLHTMHWSQLSTCIYDVSTSCTTVATANIHFIQMHWFCYYMTTKATTSNEEQAPAQPQHGTKHRHNRSKACAKQLLSQTLPSISIVTMIYVQSLPVQCWNEKEMYTYGIWKHERMLWNVILELSSSDESISIYAVLMYQRENVTTWNVESMELSMSLEKCVYRPTMRCKCHTTIDWMYQRCHERECLPYCQWYLPKFADKCQCYDVCYSDELKKSGVSSGEGCRWIGCVGLYECVPMERKE